MPNLLYRYPSCMQNRCMQQSGFVHEVEGKRCGMAKSQKLALTQKKHEHRASDDCLRVLQNNRSSVFLFFSIPLWWSTRHR